MDDCLALVGDAVQRIELRHSFVQVLCTEYDRERTYIALLVKQAEIHSKLVLRRFERFPRRRQLLAQKGLLCTNTCCFSLERCEARLRSVQARVERVQIEHRVVCARLE
jgi:hypothetical protein